VQELRHEYPLKGLLKLAGLARSTFYYQQQRPVVGNKHAGMKKRIEAIFHRHKGRYGYRRVTAAIRREGTFVNHKRIQRLMSLMGLKSLVRIKKYRVYRGDVGHVAPNVLNRRFTAKRPNEKWVTDVTEFNLAGQRLYLSPIMDLYNGEIVSFQMARRPLYEMISSMLSRAIARLRPGDRPILHSDQGWLYRMPLYRKTLHQHSIKQSMSRRGNCLDNAAMESFFGTLKSEFYYLNPVRSLEELQAGLRAYIHYYNHDRIKLNLGGLSPVGYRTQANAI
jgi:putative transposase